MGATVLSFIQAMQSVDKTITREEFKEIRNNGTEEELIRAVMRVEEAGGYDNLD